MRREVRFARIDRRHAILDALPASRVPVRVTSFSAIGDHPSGPEQADDPADIDDLRAARGMLAGVLLSVGLWAVIGLVVYLIAR